MNYSLSNTRSERSTILVRVLLRSGFLLGLLVAGCTGPNSDQPAARPGSGLKEYQQLVLGLRKATAASRQSVETVMRSPEDKFQAACRRLAASIEKLEVTSIESRSRAEAMEKRGEAYFEEWAEELSGLKDEASQRAAREQLDDMRRHFRVILEQSRQVRQQFRKYLDGLRSLRARLGKEATLAALEKTPPPAAQVVSDGLIAEQTMESLLAALGSAQQAVKTLRNPPHPSGAKP